MNAYGRWARDALIVARFDLAESLRSRKVMVFLILYVAAAVASTAIFTDLLQEIEEELATQLLVARTSAPGSMTQAVMERPEVRRVLAGLVRDDELAGRLITKPPIALLYHWVALAFAPLFVILTSSDTISSELSSGSVRFSLARTDRSAWVAGKLLGQATMLFSGLALGALGAWITGYVQLATFEPLRTLVWLVRYTATAYVYALGYLLLALGISQLTRSVPWSRALGLVSLAIVSGAHGLLRGDYMERNAPVIGETMSQLFFPAHRLDLWRESFSEVIPGVVAILALGTLFFVGGHLRFARRDA